MTLTQTIKAKLSNIFDYEKMSENLTEHLKHLSAETIGWLAAILIHLATIPTLVAVLTGLTEKMPPVDLVLFGWVGLFLLFVKATIQKDLLNIVTIGFGFFIQASIMALIIFK
jgi:membrane protein YqaA with SNARE-associated domain